MLKLAVSEHCFKSRCRQTARCCGAKHISKSKCSKHITFGALLDVHHATTTTSTTTTTITLQLQLPLPLPLHYTTLHYTDYITLIILHYTATTTTSTNTHTNSNVNILHYITLHQVHYTTLIALHFTNYTTLH